MGHINWANELTFDSDTLSDCKYFDTIVGAIKEDPIVSESLIANNPSDVLGKIVGFIIPNIRVKILSFATHSGILTADVHINLGNVLSIANVSDIVSILFAVTYVNVYKPWINENSFLFIKAKGHRKISITILRKFGIKECFPLAFSIRALSRDAIQGETIKEADVPAIKSIIMYFPKFFEESLEIL
jgi:hypothetical protein